MGGCSAATQVGWGFLCQAGSVAWRAQAIAGRLVHAGNAVSALGPLQLALVLVLALVGLALAWHIYLAFAQVIYRCLPLVLVAGLAVLYFTH